MPESQPAQSAPIIPPHRIKMTWRDLHESIGLPGYPHRTPIAALKAHFADLAAAGDTSFEFLPDDAGIVALINNSSGAWEEDRKPPAKRGEPKTLRAPSVGMRFKILKRDNFTCVYCGRKAPEVEIHCDHIIPFSKGGLTVEENLAAACSDCNLGKGART